MGRKQYINKHTITTQLNKRIQTERLIDKESNSRKQYYVDVSGLLFGCCSVTNPQTVIRSESSHLSH